MGSFRSHLSFKKTFAHIKETAIRNTLYAGDAIAIGGLIGIIFYPIYYIAWTYWWPQPYESFWIRFIATILCVIVVFHKKWPEKLKRYLPLYWHVGMIFCLPYFATYLLLKNDFSTVWVSATPICFFLVVILYIDWLIISLIYFSGTVAAWFGYWLMTGDLSFFPKYWDHLPQFFFAICAGLVCNYYIKQSIINNRLHATYSAATNIAHELGTPLQIIRSGLNNILYYWPELMRVFKQATQSHQIKSDLSLRKLNHLDPLIERLLSEVDYSSEIIRSLLINTNKNLINVMRFNVYSISTCIDMALSRYPFKHEQRKLIHYQPNQDFNFYGSDVLLSQVIHNLMKNALYFITKARKGEIRIELIPGKNKNLLRFTDTGTGIHAVEIEKIFSRFYTTTPDGTGIGLAFCKDVMESFQGRIYCESVVGEFTTFTLIFPAIDKSILNQAENNEVLYV